MPDRRDKPKGKLTVSAAQAVNDLLHYLGVQERPAKHPTGPVHVPPERARDGAVLLADLAHNAIYAGLDGDDVLHAWTTGAAPHLAVRRLVAPASDGLGEDTCGARHPTHPQVRCQIELPNHPRSYHEAPAPDYDRDGPRVVWAVDSFRPPVRPKPPVPDQLAAGQRPRGRR